MRKAFGAVPILAAGAFAAAIIPAAAANAMPVPLPQTYPWCELDLYCYDDDLDIVLDGDRHDDTQYGGGFLTPRN